MRNLPLDLAILLLSACDENPTGADMGVPSDIADFFHDQAVSVDGAILPDLVAGDAILRPAGQCVSDDECADGGYWCFVGAPGGFCTGCSGTCPLGSAYQCTVSNCLRNCLSDNECPEGLRCSTTSFRCLLIGCGDGGSCPSPYSCQSNACKRPPCDAGCPMGWVCREPYCTER
jgi:hypothetical protein